MPTDILLKLTTFNLFVKFIEQGKGSRQPKKNVEKEEQSLWNKCFEDLL